MFHATRNTIYYIYGKVCHGEYGEYVHDENARGRKKRIRRGPLLAVKRRNPVSGPLITLRVAHCRPILTSTDYKLFSRRALTFLLRVFHRQRLLSARVPARVRSPAARGLAPVSQIAHTKPSAIESLEKRRTVNVQRAPRSETAIELASPT